jgi:hypothetical protein
MTVMRAQDFQHLRYPSPMQYARNGSGTSRPCVRSAPFFRPDLRSGCRGLPVWSIGSERFQPNEGF